MDDDFASDSSSYESPFKQQTFNKIVEAMQNNKRKASQKMFKKNSNFALKQKSSELAPTPSLNKKKS